MTDNEKRQDYNYPTRWSKEIQNIYFHSFRESGYHVSNKIFSQQELYDCLGTSTADFKSLIHLLKISVTKIPKSCLILGSGSGNLTTLLRQQYTNSLIYEIDVNKTVIRRLKKMLAADKQRLPVLGNILHLPFQDNMFDVVLGYGIFRYIKYQKQAIAEINRVLRNDGMSLIGEGRKKEYIEHTIKVLSQMNITHHAKTLTHILMPHVTFFYFLLERYNTNHKIKQLIDDEMQKKKTSKIRSAFTLAGSSYGNLYTVRWYKK